MIVSKDRICEFLYGVQQATALNIAKNVGFYKAKHVHITLYQLEKQGDLCRQGITPPMWALTDKKRSRMQRKKGVTVEVAVGPVEVGPPPDCIAAEDEDCTPADDDMDSTGAEAVSPPPPAPLQAPPSNPATDDDRVETAFAPIEGLNMRHFADFGDLSEKVALTPARISVLRQCLESDPVSGLIRYSQYRSQKCEFMLLAQSGPSHEPVFEMQAVLDYRRFPPCIGSNKKAAKKEAASIALKILLREAMGEEGYEFEAEEQKPQPPDPAEMDEEEEEEEEEAPEAPPTPPPPPPEPEAPPAPPKNPISTLMEYTQRTGVPCEFIIVPHEIVINHPKFSFVVRLGNRTFPPVTASNKKMAKQLAAEAAVRLLEEESGPLLPPVPEKQPKST